MFTTDITAALMSVHSSASTATTPSLPSSPPTQPSLSTLQSQSTGSQILDDVLGFPSDDDQLETVSASKSPVKPRQAVVRINQKWSRILCSAYVMCDMKMDSLFRESRVKDVMSQIKKAMEEKTKKIVSDDAIRTKIQTHIYSKNTTRNEKKGNRVGTKKRSAIIANIDEDISDDDEDVESDMVRPLNEVEQLLDDGEADHLSSATDSAAIRSAEDFIEFAQKEKSNTQMRN